VRNNSWKMDLETGRCDTPMYSAKIWELGPGALQGPNILPDPSSKRPYIAHAVLAPGMEAASAAHAGWSWLYILAGSVTVDGKELGPGAMTLAEPYSPSGPVKAGPEGVVELAIYENGYAALPYFPDPDDPQCVALRQSLASQGLELPPPTVPSGALTGRRIALDSTTDRWETPYFDAKTWQIGPLGQIPELPLGEEAATSTYPFVSHGHCKHGVERWPDHRHDGWNALLILQGGYVGPDYSTNAGDLWISSPQHVALHDVVPGPDGVTELAIFDCGHCLTPVILDANDEASAEFADQLHIA